MAEGSARGFTQESAGSLRVRSCSDSLNADAQSLQGAPADSQQILGVVPSWVLPLQIEDWMPESNSTAGATRVAIPC
eukprot:16448813-Heterocapsa_arctica.AAC.1